MTEDLQPSRRAVSGPIYLAIREQRPCGRPIVLIRTLEDVAVEYESSRDTPGPNQPLSFEDGSLGPGRAVTKVKGDPVTSRPLREVDSAFRASEVTSSPRHNSRSCWQRWITWQPNSPVYGV